MYTIYALADPRTHEIRYIGQTQKHPTVRLEDHLQKHDENAFKQDWFSDLRRLNLKPIVVILEYAPDINEALFCEREWIRRGKRLGWVLLNVNRPIVHKKNPGQYQKKIVERKPDPAPANIGPTDLQALVFAWRDVNQGGTQAQLRREFAARGISIARSYVCDVWHRWPAATVAQASNEGGA